MKLNICSFNIKCTSPRDGINTFENRTPLIAKAIDRYQPDLIGFQEGGQQKADWAEANLNDYVVLGTHMSLDEPGAENTLIAYRKDRFDLLSLESFRLSETPYVPLTKFYSDQGFCYRVCTRVILRDKQEGKILRYYNTHLDHEGDCCQAQGLSQILRCMVQDDFRYPNTPVVLTGDFNMAPDKPALKGLSDFRLSAGRLRDASENIGDTFHDFGRAQVRYQIDYIFTNAACDPTRSFCWEDYEDGIWLSDHYPIQATIEI